MHFNDYLQYFETILNNTQNPQEPYNDSEFMEYTKLNWSRLNRWIKTGELLDETKKTIQNIQTKQHL